MWEWLAYWWQPILGLILMGAIVWAARWENARIERRYRAWIEQTVACQQCRGSGRHAPWSVTTETATSGGWSQRAPPFPAAEGRESCQPRIRRSDVDNQVAERTVARIRAARLDEFKQRAGTGHSGTDAEMLVDEVRRFRAFLTDLADEIDATGPTPELSARLRNAARAVGE